MRIVDKAAVERRRVRLCAPRIRYLRIIIHYGLIHNAKRMMGVRRRRPRYPSSPIHNAKRRLGCEEKAPKVPTHHHPLRPYPQCKEDDGCEEKAPKVPLVSYPQCEEEVRV